MGGRGSRYSRTRGTMPLKVQLGGVPVQPQQNDDQQQQPLQATQNPVDGAQRITDPEALYDFFDRAANDDNAVNAMLSQWRAEAIDIDGRQQDDDITRFFNYIGWTSNLPDVMTENQYQQAWQQAGQPQQMYHADRPAGGVGARQFAAQYMGNGYAFNGTQYRHYLSNGYYGNGTYFATTASESAGYGSSQFRGFLNSKAKIGSYSQLSSELSTFRRTHPAFNRMFNKLTGGYSGSTEQAAVSIWAAMRGYNVIHNGWDYYTVLDRSVTTVSNKTVHSHMGMKDW